MMKKALSLILALVMYLSLCACGTPPTENSTTAPSTTSPHVHSFGKWTVTKEPSCQRKGTEVRTCECGETESRKIDATGHTYVESLRLPTSTSPVDIYYIYTCSCGMSYTQKMETQDHSYLIVGFCYDENYGIYCEITGVDGWEYQNKFGWDVPVFVIPSEIDGYPVLSIGTSAFTANYGAINIVIPSGVFKIGNYAFEEYYSLERITIPNTVTHIGNGAFAWCMCLEEINFDGTIAQWRAIHKGDNWFWEKGNIVVNCTDGTCSADIGQ